MTLKEKSSIEFRVIWLPKNLGHGEARRISLRECNNSLVALMDADDISVPNRFELQLECFNNNPDLSVVGGQIIEFDGEEDNYTGIRRVPERNTFIREYMKKRCPMNQMSVMFRKEDVEAVGGYIDWYCEEDYYLWIRMLEAGYIFENVPSIIVKVRAGEEMSSRRGGRKYFNSEKALQRYMYERRIISLHQYCYNVLIRYFGEVIVNNSIRQKLFMFMRSSIKKEDFTYYVSLDNNEHNTRNKNVEEFSVAICVYDGDKAEWFDKALESIVNQTVKPSEIVLVVDGPVNDDIKGVIDKFSRKEY